MPDQTKFKTIEEIASYFKSMDMSTVNFEFLDKDGEFDDAFAQFKSPMGGKIVEEPAISKSVDMVREFHRQINAEISDSPTLLKTNADRCRTACRLLEDTLAECRQLATDDDTLLSRLCLSLEETLEWLQSHINEDLVAAADAIGDRAYVLFGDAVAAGMPLHEIFDEIHRSNMSKLESKKGALGKANKSGDYSRPELAAVLLVSQLDTEFVEDNDA